MFGLSWAQIGIIVLVGAFVLGPERIPTAVTFVTGNLRKVRSLAAGAQSDLRREIGPELDELRRQVADLRSLTELQGLRDLQDLHPKRLLSKNLLGDELSGGITGFLGLKADPPKILTLGAPATDGGAPATDGGAPATDGGATATAAVAESAVHGQDGLVPVAVDGPVSPSRAAGPVLPPHLPPAMATFFEPQRAGIALDPDAWVLVGAMQPPFDTDGT